MKEPKLVCSHCREEIKEAQSYYSSKDESEHLHKHCFNSLPISEQLEILDISIDDILNQFDIRHKMIEPF